MNRRPKLRNRPAVRTIALLALSCVLVAVSAHDAGAATATTVTKEGIDKFKAARSEEDVQAAIALFRQAIRLDSKYVPGHAWLGTALVESEAWRAYRDEAIGEFETVLRLDPDGKKYGWDDVARSWLMKLRGRPRRLLLLPAASGGYQDVTRRVVEAMERHRSPDYELADRSVIQGRSLSDSELCRIAYRDGIGWVAVAETVRYAEPTWTKYKPLLSKQEKWGYNASGILEVRIRLLDPANSKTTAAWSVQSSGLYHDSASEATNAATDYCGERGWDRMAAVMGAEDAVVKEEAGMLSMPTDVPSVYAKVGTKNRQLAQAMPILLLLGTRNACESSEGDVEAALDATSQVLFKDIVGKQTLAVVPPRELAKLKDRRPDAWDVGKAIEFARTLGSNCRWVAIPQITEFSAWVRESGFLILNEKRGMARMRLSCMIADVRTGEVVATVEARVEGKSKSETLTTEELEEMKLLATNDAVAKAAEMLATEIVSKTTGSR